jgi:uncharacterized membrane protein YczE
LLADGCRIELRLQGLQLQLFAGRGLLHLAFQPCPCQLGLGFLFQLGLAQLLCQLVTLLLRFADGIVHGQLARHGFAVQLHRESLDFRVLGSRGLLQLCLQPRGGQSFGTLLFALCLGQLVDQPISLFFQPGQGLGQRQPVGQGSCLKLVSEILDLGILVRGIARQLTCHPGLLQRDGVPLILFRQLQPLMQLLFQLFTLLVELTITNLLLNIRVAGFVNLERFFAMRANDFVHGSLWH